MKTIQSKSKQFVSMVAVFFMVLFGIMASGCGGGGGGGGVAAPGAPTNFVVVATPAGGNLSATLAWSPPTTGGEPTSYEIYKYSTTELIPEPPVFDPDNHLITIPVVEGQTLYEFIDNAGLERGVYTYWIVTAKNAGGETPTLPEYYQPAGGGVGEVDTYGNNFAAAMIFADGIGISNQEITGSWTKTVADIDYNTGLRPDINQTLPVDTLPYLEPTTTFELGGVTYYKQKTASIWQGEWIDGSTSGEHNVTAKWGDNLISQTLNTESVVRIEMKLTEELDTNMTAYNMVSLYGSKEVEIYGTDGTEYNTTTAFVFTAYARLTIQQVDGLGGSTIGEPLEDQLLFDDSVADGPGKFAAEINVAGDLTYGYIWDLKTNPLPAGAGTYRITFTLVDPSNVIIGDVAVPDEGEDPYTLPVLDSEISTYLDITIN